MLMRWLLYPTNLQKKDVDLLLIDSGDLHDGQLRAFMPTLDISHERYIIGTGLSDGFPAGGVDAHEVRVLKFLGKENLL